MTDRRHRRLRPHDLQCILNGTVYPFMEDDEATGIYGYGHIRKELFTELVNKYDRSAELRPEDWDPDSAYTPLDVDHGFAIAEAPEKDSRVTDENWIIMIVPEDTDGATPITYVNR